MERIKRVMISIFCLLLCVTACGTNNGAGENSSGSNAGKKEQIHKERGNSAYAASQTAVLTTDGEVTVTDKNGITLELAEEMELESGSGIHTGDSGCAWLAMDVGTLRLDRLSDVERVQSLGNWTLLNNGSLFFHGGGKEGKKSGIRTPSSSVTLSDKASGYIATLGNSKSELCVLSGSVEFSGYEPVTMERETAEVSAGQKAVCELFADAQEEGDRVEIAIFDMKNEDLVAFAADEVAKDHTLQEEINREKSGLKASVIMKRLAQLQTEEKQALEVRREELMGLAEAWGNMDSGVSDEMFWHIIYNTSTGTESYGGIVSDYVNIASAGSGKPSKRKTPGKGGSSGGSGSSEDSGPGDSGSGSSETSTEWLTYEDLIVSNQGTIVSGGEYGNVTVAASVADGDVTLTGVTIHGNLLIQGGGSSSVHVNDCTLGGTIVMDKSTGEAVHLELTGTEAEMITVASGNGTAPATITVGSGSSVGTLIAKTDVKISTQDGGKVKRENVTLAVHSGESLLSKLPKVTLDDVTIAPTKLPENAAGHEYVLKNKDIIEPLCTAQGYTVFTYECSRTDCEACRKNGGKTSYSYVGDFTPCAPHNFEHLENEAELSQMGFTEHFCTNCGYCYIDDFCTYGQNK